jgi:hypothetical protein
MQAKSGKTVEVSGVKFVLTQKMYSLMGYFAESEAICQTDCHVLNAFKASTWEKMISILKAINY